MKLLTQTRTLNIVVITALAILFLCGCRPQKQVGKAAGEIIPVKIYRVIARDFNEAIDYVGSIKAQDEAMVYPKVSGKIIEKVKQEGDTITKGEPIAYIDRDEVGLKFEQAPVESPISGVVGKVYVDIGVNVDNQTAVALVVNMDKVKIKLDIPEKYIPKVSLNQEAVILVDAYPQEEFSGRVTKIAPVLDSSTRTASVEITVDNPQLLLKSGMFSRVKLILQKTYRRAGDS